MASTTRTPSQLTRAISVGFGAVVSGIGSYVLIIVAARGLNAEQYSDFAAFWALSVTAGLGLFFPVEQETARESASSQQPGRGLLRTVAWGSVSLVALGIAASLLLLTPGAADFVGGPDLVLALICSYIGYALQFSIRGFLSGAARTGSYTIIIATEGFLRVALPAVLLLLGMSSPFGYAMTVTAAAVLAVAPVLFTRNKGEWLRRPSPSAAQYFSRLARLVGAALSVQLILNSGTILARLDAQQDAALAGQILVCLSISRIPVFVYQVAQMLYLPRLAGAYARRDHKAMRAIVVAAFALAALTGVVVVAGMVWLGAPIISWFFAPDLVLRQDGILLVSAGSALFLVALVASDGCIAIHRHTSVLRSWFVAVAAGAVLAIVLTDPLLRATLPMIVASLVALGQLVALLMVSYTQLTNSGGPGGPRT